VIFDLKAALLVGGAALVIGLSMGGVGAWKVRGMQADRDLSGLRSTYDRAYAASSEQARAKESELQAIADELRTRVPDEDAKTDTDHAAADASADGLRIAAGMYAAAASCNAATEQRGKAATSAAMVLSDLLAACNAGKSAVAATADESYKRALRCEGQYDRTRDALKNSNALQGGSQE
jgi:hypothetical protein